MHPVRLAVLFIAAACLPLAARAQVTLTGGALSVGLSPAGDVTSLRNGHTELRYPAADAPLLTIVSGDARHHPRAMTSRTVGGARELTLTYPTLGATVVVRARETADYVAFEIIRAEPADRVHAVVWGPYPTTVSGKVGEVIGVSRNATIALGLQVLNAKTLGGALPNREGSTWARGIAATAMPWGSTLQAYAINRDRARTVDGWVGDYPNMPVAPIAGETVVGSAIALFSCAEPLTLDVIERIAKAEHLPYPTLDGVWFKRSKLFGRSYLISDFSESEVDEMIGYTKRAGLFSLYHEGPFKSWGHFVLDSARWPSGRRGMKAAVDKAHAAGLHFGTHTLTTFINTNDPYVTPVPDDRLAVTGTSTLVANIDATQSTIEVASPEFFANVQHDNLHTVKIGSELIQFAAVTNEKPFRLLECKRGAFGTAASAHRAGDTVGKLLDHAYKVFFPNFAIQRDVAKNLADFLNETGVDHIDFDGFEGALASGQGDYALGVFAQDVLSQVKHDLINGPSISKTFYWHIGSYYNWGEPWYGGFAESMQQYRIDNQALFDRNFMPHMLGWYLLTEKTTLPEMEWMLARAAGYDAGFAMVARPKALRANALTPQLLDAIREWEAARAAHAFTDAEVTALRDPRRGFHLEKVRDGAWRLQETTPAKP